MVQRRGYTAREFDLTISAARWRSSMFEREYSADEIWANYTYFVKAVLPVAEEAKVKLALHPDDPPLAKMNGVAKLFTHYDGYHRAEQIAGGQPLLGAHVLRGHVVRGRRPDGQERLRDDSRFRRPRQDLRSPLPQRQLAAAALCGDVSRTTATWICTR